MRFYKYLSENYEVPLRIKKKEKKLNPKTNRMKNFKKTRYIKTDIPPEERNFDNIPKYSDGSSKVRFQDWLEIDTSKSKGKNWGWAKNGYCYGWSHRTVYGFKKGDKVDKEDAIGRDTKRNVPYKIKDDKDAENHAIRFAREVA